MAFMVKHMIGGQLKDLTGGVGEEKPEAEKTEAAAKGMTEEEFEQYQEQLAEEKWENRQIVFGSVNCLVKMCVCACACECVCV